MFVSHLVTSAPFSTSDHDSLIFSLLIDSRIDTTLTNKSNVCSYDFVNADFQSINYYWSQIDCINEFALCQSAAAVWDSFNGYINHVIANFVPTKYHQSKRSNYKSNKFKRYHRFITKLLAKKLRCWHRYKYCPNDITKAAYYKSFTDARSGISTIINILKRKSLIAIMSVLFTNLLITNLAVKVALGQ